MLGGEIGLGLRFGTGSYGEIWAAPTVRLVGIPLGNVASMSIGLIAGLPPHVGHRCSSSVPLSTTPSPLQSGQVFICGLHSSRWQRNRRGAGGLASRDCDRTAEVHGLSAAVLI